MTMSPQNTLSGATQARIEARVSRNGNATPATGDLIGESTPVAPGESRVDDRPSAALTCANQCRSPACTAGIENSLPITVRA